MESPRRSPLIDRHAEERFGSDADDRTIETAAERGPQVMSRAPERAAGSCHTTAGALTGAPTRGAATPAGLRVGCSGWSYQNWRGVVYPTELPQRLWLKHYQGLFDTVELKSTFHDMPSPAAVAAWAAAAAPGFLFAVKLGQVGTHQQKLRDPSSWLPDHLERVDQLGEHLGPNLVQLPPLWPRDTGRLDEFLSAAPTTMRWAIEFREPSWLHDDVFDVLRRHGAALCVHDLLPGHPFELTTDWTYVRFHGSDALDERYRGAYGHDRLDAWAARLGAVLDDGHDVFAYFNNDWEGNAVADAALLRQALATDRPHPPDGAAAETDGAPA